MLMTFTIKLHLLGKSGQNSLAHLIADNRIRRGKHGVHYFSYKVLPEVKKMLTRRELLKSVMLKCHLEEVRYEHLSFVVIFALGNADCAELLVKERIAVKLLSKSGRSDILAYDNEGSLYVDDNEEGSLRMDMTDYYDTMTDEEKRTLLTAVAVDTPRRIFSALGWTKETSKENNLAA